MILILFVGAILAGVLIYLAVKPKVKTEVQQSNMSKTAKIIMAFANGVISSSVDVLPNKPSVKPKFYGSKKRCKQTISVRELSRRARQKGKRKAAFRKRN